MEPGLGIPPVSQLISEDSRQSTCRSSDWENNSTRCQSGLDWDSHSSKPLNFATNPDDCDIQSVKKPKTPRDPMSHRIIEKRRRDRMNNCLADLSRLIPANYMKQGQGRIEKTEIIEMAIKHIKQLKAKLESFDMADVKKQQVDPTSAYIHQKPCCSEKFYMGFKECEAELMRFLVEREGWDAKDQICSRLMKQLDEASKKYTGNFGSLETFGNDGKKDPDCQQLSIHVYGSSECMSVEPYTSPAPSSVYDGDMLDVMQFRGGNFNGYNMNSDKHLRTLLQKNAEHNSTENESGIASLSTREPEANLSGDLVNGSDKSNSSTIQETLELSEDCRGGCLAARRSDDASTYKFKQNITLRFSEEKRKASDTSSISSREGGTKVKVRRKVAKAKSLSPQSDSSIYPTSDYSSNGNGTSSSGDNPSQGLMPDDHKDIKDEFSLKGASLPGFILHPIGSFYLPISLSESQVSMLGLFTESSLQHHATLLHPISIAVNFGSHSLTMRNINIQSSFAQNRAMFCDGDQMGCQKV